MSSVNKVILIGRLGKDPDVRYTSSGGAVANLSLATEKQWKDRSGERQKKTEWHTIVVFGKSVENFVQKYLHKGNLVYIEGELQTRKWTDKKDNSTRYTTEVIANDIKILEKPQGQGSSNSGDDESVI
jgi:single-strand DNA-binding protein